VFGLESFAFQAGCPAWIIRFSLLGEGLFVPAATVGFAMVYRWNYRCREWVVNTADDGEKTCKYRSIPNMVRFATVT